MKYSEKIVKQAAEKQPNYFMCGERDVPELMKKARKEADEILKDFKEYFAGDITIDIEARDHDLCYSIAAILRVNGIFVEEEDPCHLLFLELNNLELSRLLKIRQLSENP